MSPTIPAQIPEGGARLDGHAGEQDGRGELTILEALEVLRPNSAVLRVSASRQTNALNGILAVSDFCMIRSFYNVGFVAIPWPAQLER
jgi:hypothetical protein